jgi:hypothetical protein
MTTPTLPRQAAAYDLEIEIGADRDIPLTITGPDETTPVNLTGYEARFTARFKTDDTTALLDLSTDNGKITITPATGQVTIHLTHADTAPITQKRGVYDFWLIDANGRWSPELYGAITFHQEVTRDA